MHFSLRLLFPAALVLAMMTATVSAQPAPKNKFNVPPSANLEYAIKARQSGLTLEGNAVVRWTSSPGKFTVSSETRAALVGKILDARSEGTIDAYGLAPTSFTEKRFRRDPTTTSFDRASKTIHFANSEQTRPIKGGEQDHSSALWQLISLARATPPGKVKPGFEWRFVVAGHSDAEPWIFKVVKPEKVSTPMGEMSAVHISRVLPANSKDQTLDIWLAPSLEWYPVRVRFAEPNGDFIEQTLKEAKKT